MKASFFKRVFAFIIDILILNSLVSLVTVFVPVDDNVTNLNNEIVSANEAYLAGEIDSNTYLDLIYSAEYDLQKETIPISIISLVVSLLYFVVLPFYYRGMTLGKKLMKIKIVKSDGSKIEMNDLVVRSFINNTIFISLVELVLIFVIKTPKIMVTISVVLTYLQLIVLFISFIMILFTNKKQGIHGIISKTDVVEV